MKLSRARKTILFVSILVLGGLVGYAMASLQARGLFEDWQSLGAPPGGGVEILDSYGYNVIVRSGNGEVYECVTWPHVPCWDVVDWPVQIDDPYEIDNREMISSGEFWIRNTPENSVDTIYVSSLPGAEEYAEAKFVLLEDGSVQFWRHGVHGMLGIWAYVVFICWGIVGGLVLGTVVLIWISRYRSSGEKASGHGTVSA